MTAGRWQAGLVGLAGAIAAIATLPFPQSLPVAALAPLVVLVAVVDAERFIIPDSANVCIALLGLFSVFLESEAFGSALGDAVLRGAVAALLLYAMRVVYLWRAGVPGLGLGDVKLAAAAGPWLDWGMLLAALEVGAVAALLGVAWSAWRSGERLGRHFALPFGAFLAPALWLCAFAQRAFDVPALLGF